MSKAKDWIGERVGRLTVLEFIGSIELKPGQQKKRVYLCRCDCGNYKAVLAWDLSRQHVRSCGCLSKIRKHGMTNTRLMRIYNNMKQRCKSHPNYVKLGISVCEEWSKNSSAFLSWAKENGYSDNLTLDRINPYGNYEPDNCRWITISEQQYNKTNNHTIEINGETKCIAEWAKESGLRYQTIRERVERGVVGEDVLAPVGELFNAPKQYRTGRFHFVTINGQTKTLTEWSRISGVSKTTILGRIKRGRNGNELLAKPKSKNNLSVICEGVNV